MSFRQNTIKFLIAVFCLGLAQPVAAQGQMGQQRQQPSPKQMSQQLTSAMAELLDLNDSKEAKVYDINLDYLKANQKMRASGKVSQAKAKALFSERQESLKQVLSDEQFETLKAEQEKQRQRQMQQRQQMQRQRQQGSGRQN